MQFNQGLDFAKDYLYHEKIPAKYLGGYPINYIERYTNLSTIKNIASKYTEYELKRQGLLDTIEGLRVDGFKHFVDEFIFALAILKSDSGKYACAVVVSEPMKKYYDIDIKSVKTRGEDYGIQTRYVYVFDMLKGLL